MISYDKFWTTLENRGISQYSLIKDYKVSSSQLNRLRKNQPVSTSTLDNLCNILGCKVQDVIEITLDNKE